MNGVLSLALVALAVMNCEALFPGMGGPAMGMGGPPPFVQAKIASKGFPGAGGPPGLGMGMGGPPPFVQAKIASKGMGAGGPMMGAGPPPFVQALMAQKASPFGAGYGGAESATEDPSAMGPPAYIQSLIAAKSPFGMGKPIGPPAFVQQLIAAKNAAAEAEAQALAAQQASLYENAQPAGTDEMSGLLPPYIQDMINAKAAAAGPFAPAVTNGAASKSAGPPPDWIVELIKSNMAAKAAKPTPSYAYGSAGYSGSQFGANSPAYNYSMSKRDVSSQSSTAPQQQQPALSGPMQSQPFAMSPYGPFFAPYSAPQPQPALAPSSVPMVPMYPPVVPPFMPYWKVMG